MIGIDTNILLRWLVDESIWPDDNPSQTEAVARLLGQNETIYVNAVTLSETLWVLSKPMKQTKAVIAELIDRLLAAANVDIENRAAVAAARRGFHRGKAGIHDRLIGEFNRLGGCSTTMTFDQDASETPGFTLLKA